jgi:TPR repeat protein
MAPREKAKRLRKVAAKGNSAQAQFEYGLLHLQGEEGVKRDVPTAAEWIRKAAVQGLAGAQSNLGIMYMTGEGVERDEEQAVGWWRKAASQDPDSDEKHVRNAQHNLARAYDTGGEGGHTRALFSSTLRSWLQPS